MKKENNEQEIKILNNAQNVGVIVVVAICVFFLVANAVTSFLGGFETNFVSFDYLAIMFVYLSVVCIYSFAKHKNIYHLIIGLGFAFIFICAIILHFIGLGI